MLFVTEGYDQLEVLEQGLIRLEHEPTNVEIVHDLFRAAHTLKGSAGTAGATDITGVAHTIESLLAQLREGKVPFSNRLRNSLQRALEYLRQTLQHFWAW